MLNKRQEIIIKLLNDNYDWTTGRQLSVILNVSDRTIRSDIKRINASNNHVHILSDFKKGYRIDYLTNKTNSIPNNIPQTFKERCTLIMYSLLTKKYPLYKDYLYDPLYISSTHFSRCLNQVSKTISFYPTLKLENKENNISIQGHEIMKRKLYKDILNQKLVNNASNLDAITSVFNDFDLLIIRDTFNEVCLTYNYQIKETEVPELLIDIGITIQRLLLQEYLPPLISNNTLLKSTEYKISTEFFKMIHKQLFIEIPHQEIIFFTSQLMTKEIEETKDNINLNNKSKSLTYQIIEDIHLNYDIDFSEDKEFIENLSSYMAFLLQRTHASQVSIPPYIPDIRYKYPYLMDIALLISIRINAQMRIDICEEDIYFLVQYIGSALERMNLEKTYKILLIYPSHEFCSQSLIEKIEFRYSHLIKSIDCIDYYEKKKVIEISPDLILTTLPLIHDLDIITLQISIFLNQVEELKIIQALHELEKKNLMKFFKNNIAHMFDESFFYKKDNLRSLEEVIHFMSEDLYLHHIVDKNFESSTIKREYISSTDSLYAYATPHPIMANSTHSKISVLILENPILWKETHVKIVFLLAIQPEDQKYTKIFFDWIYTVMKNPTQTLKLMNCDNFNSFRKLLFESE